MADGKGNGKDTTNNNSYRRMLEAQLKGRSLDDLLRGNTEARPSAAEETFLLPAVSSSAVLKEKTQPLENSEKEIDQRAAASHKLFADIHSYRKFKKYDFGSFRFPFFKKLSKLDYAKLVASGTAQRVALTLQLIRAIERAGNTSVYLQEISNVDDLTSLLSFSQMPYDNASAEWPVVKEETEITKGYDLYETPRGRVGKIYYILPHLHKYFAVTGGDGIISPEYWKEKPILGGIGIVYFDSGIKDEKHNHEVDFNIRALIYGFFPKKKSY